MQSFPVIKTDFLILYRYLPAQKAGPARYTPDKQLLWEKQ